MIGPAGIPIELGRDEARELAEHELSDPAYQRDVSPMTRVIEWIAEMFERLVSGVAGAIPGQLALGLILAAVLVVAVIVILRTGPLGRRSRPPGDPIFTERRTAADHRAAADAATRAGRWSEAVTERFRAVVTGLEERGIIEPRAGRTADEVARDAGESLPGEQEKLAAGARLFDRVLYGDGTATADDDAAMRELDASIQRARPGGTVGRRPVLAVPR